MANCETDKYYIFHSERAIATEESIPSLIHTSYFAPRTSYCFYHLVLRTSYVVPLFMTSSIIFRGMEESPILMPGFVLGP